MSASAYSRGMSDWLYVGIYGPANDIVDSYDFTTPLSYAVQPGDTAVGTVMVYDADFEDFTSGELTPTSVTVAELTNSVPEPASWAMMIAGFGLVGAGLRTRRRHPVRLTAAFA